MKLLKMAKMARGKMSLDEVMEACSAVGVDVKLDPITGAALPEFEALAKATQEPGAKFFRLEAEMGGQKCFALAVLRG